MALWLTLEEEAAAIDDLLASGRVAVDVLGESVEGRPIRLLRIGDPPPAVDDRAVLLLVGGQHGDEPAGREALIRFADYLSTTTDTAEVTFLQQHGVLIIPTVNPDGRLLNQDENAAGVNPNRDWVSLSQPETQAVAPVLGSARPLIVVDMHGADGQVSDATFLWPTAPAVHEDIAAEGESVVDAMKARMDVEGWTHANFSGGDRAHLLRNTAGLMHAAGVLIETSKVDDTTSGRQHRVDVQYAMAEEALAYAITNAAALLAQAEAAADDKAAEGSAGTVPFDLAGNGGVVLDPPPLGYRLTGVVPTFHLQVFGVSITSAGVVSMAQAAQPVIPHLFDAAADDTVVLGIRLLALEAPVVVPTVAELAPIVSSPHRVRIEARVVTGLPTGLDPDGVEIPVLGGSVTWDGTADILGSVELTTVARWPRARERLLLPAGNEIFLRYGVDVGGSIGTLWTPLGYFRINRPTQDDVARGPITLSGEDRMCRILDARLLRPRQLSVGRTLGDIFAELVLEAMPEATIIFDDATEFSTTARTLTTEESRYKVLRELADAAGKDMFWDGEGILRISSPPDPTEPVWHLRAGPGGALISASREISREQVYNAVVVRGEGSEMADPVEAVVYDDDPDSMTYFFGPFGMVPRFYASPVIYTEDQAYSAAVSMLRRSLGLPYEVAGEIVPNPALRPGHPVRFTWDDGNRELHVWETLELPLDGESAMSGTTQRQTVARVGRM